MDQIEKNVIKWEKSKKAVHKEELFQEIWITYHPRLQVYLSQFFADSQDKTDLVSDILLKVFESIEKYNRDYSFSTWIYTVARNYSIDLLRKKKVQYEIFDDFAISDNITPESLLLRDSEQKLIKQALTILSSVDRELIFLHFYEGLKYREISEITGMPEGTIKYRMYESKKKLKKQLERSLIK